MGRVVAYLLALVLTFATSIAPAQLTQTGAGKAPSAGGGGSVAYDSSVDASSEDSTTLNSGDFTIAATSNRFALAAMVSRDFGTLATHSSMALEGAGMSQEGSAATVGAARVSRWSLVAPASGSARTLTGTLSDEDSTHLIATAVYNGVSQTTPINSTAAPTTGSFSGATSISPSITVTTVSGGKAVVVFSMNKIDTGANTWDCSGSGATIRTNEQLILETLVILEKDNTGGSTTISCNVTFATADGDWRMDGYGVQP